MNQNRLDAKNCNKAHCKSCIFHPVLENRVELSVERINEITAYLVTLKSSHICHVTNKTCYGGLELQARSAFAMKIIDKPTVESFLQTAKLYLSK